MSVEKTSCSPVNPARGSRPGRPRPAASSCVIFFLVALALLLIHAGGTATATPDLSQCSGGTPGEIPAPTVAAEKTSENSENSENSESDQNIRLEGSSCSDSPEGRAFWSTAWTITSLEDVQANVSKAVEFNFNTLLLEVRFRGDAFYFPNKYSSRYPNSEPRSHLLQDPGLDVLETAVELGHAAGLEVHAWAVVYPCTYSGWYPTDPDHVFNAHHDWVTENEFGRTMDWNELEGAYLDPGNPHATRYLFNVLMDIAWNYDIDGLHLDYIRYPGREWGHDPAALSRFFTRHGGDPGDLPGEWDHWRRGQVSDLVRTLYGELMRMKPWVTLSTAVFPWSSAWHYKLQDWQRWCGGEYLDTLIPMLYSSDTGAVLDDLAVARAACPGRLVYGGFRAWDTASPPRNPHQYEGWRIAEKVDGGRLLSVDGFSMFSLQGLRDNIGESNEDEYFHDLGDGGGPFEQPAGTPDQPWKSSPGSGLIMGLVTDSGSGTGLDFATVVLEGEGISDTTTGNGFFLLGDVDEGVYTITAEKDGYDTGHADDITLAVEPYSFVTPVIIRLDSASWEELILDNGSCLTTGSWTTGDMAPDKYGQDYLWASTDPSGDSKAWWEIMIPETGMYGIYSWWSEGSNRSGEAMYGVMRNGNMSTVTVNQQVDGGRWNLLGEWWMDDGTRLKTGIINRAPSGFVVIADAVKIVKE